jgi:hypothetical protein
LLEQEYLAPGAERSLTVTQIGAAWFADPGIEVEANRLARARSVAIMPSAIQAQPSR